MKKLRTASRVPAVIYGRGLESAQTLEIDQRSMERLLHHSASENLLVDLQVEGDTGGNRLALIQEVQHHPVTRSILHVDFHEVAADEKVTITVPVEATGDCVGVKAGGVLEHLLFRLKLCGMPKDLPDVLTTDVTELNVGEAIHIGDIKLPEGVEVLGDKHISVISVGAPRVEEEAVTEATEEVAEGGPEPEVIKEKKDEQSGDSAPGNK